MIKHKIKLPNTTLQRNGDFKYTYNRWNYHKKGNRNLEDINELKAYRHAMWHFCRKSDEKKMKSFTKEHSVQ